MAARGKQWSYFLIPVFLALIFVHFGHWYHYKYVKLASSSQFVCSVPMDVQTAVTGLDGGQYLCPVSLPPTFPTLCLPDEDSKLWCFNICSTYSLRCCMAASLVFRLHDRGPELVREVLLERGWEEYDEDEQEEEDWNLYWRGSAFHNSDYHNLLPWQRLNHHPTTVGITRKVTVGQLS